MSIKMKSWGEVDPLFPASGQVYVTENGFYLNDVHGGAKSVAWLDEHFEAREDDVYVVSYPKTGTTWCQEITYLIGNDLNFDKAKSGNMFERFPYIELCVTIEQDLVSKVSSPRFLKSHYPYSLLPKSIIDKKCKIIYPIRNPRDTVVSFYHFTISNPLFQYKGDFKTFFDLFIKDERLVYSPFWKHIMEFWELRHQENILIVHFEDLKKDSKTEIKRIANFLGKKLTEDQVNLVADHCSFGKMKSSKSTNYEQFMPKNDFLRKGEVGDWQNYFTEEMQKKMDEYVEKHFKGSGLEFKYTV